MFHRTQRHNPFLFAPRIQGMEFVTETASVEELGGVHGGGGPGDDLFVDELLDFSNGFSSEETPEEEEEQQPENRNAGSGNDAPPPPPDNLSLSAGEDFGSLHESELSAQGETLENLEWLSHFVEDSFPDYSLAGKFPPAAAPPPQGRPQQQRFVTPVQTKARTKRARTGARIRPVLSPSSSSSSSTTTNMTPFTPQPKKARRKPAEGGGGAVAPRRCSHCGVTKTPQWRAGPFGPKSLCNACGVRHKSGRLLPEYRPACSPTFSTELHSNNHRKVLEMRRKKEAEAENEAGTGSGSELLVG